MRSGDITSLAFGEDAVFADGIQLRVAGDAFEVRGVLATKAVNVICDTGNTSTGGFQTS
jgi:hypothetical protein